jgi:DNA repair photolyase
MKVTEIEAKNVLNPSKIFPYCLNPYTGCQINCRYCYARLFMRRYSGHSEPWGEFVDVKVNAAEVLRKQLLRAKRGTVWISSVCDPYQPLEQRYELTRRCLHELLGRQFPVNLQTKSALVLRDLDLLARFEEIEVGFTITTEDERIAKLFEPGASPVRERIEALARIHSAGIRTFTFLGPLLPGSAERLVEALEGKVDKVLIDRMNYLQTIKALYHRLGLERGIREGFFEEQKQRLISALREKGIPYEALF